MYIAQSNPGTHLFETMFSMDLSDGWIQSDVIHYAPSWQNGIVQPSDTVKAKRLPTITAGYATPQSTHTMGKLM